MLSHPWLTFHLDGRCFFYICILVSLCCWGSRRYTFRSKKGNWICCAARYGGLSKQSIENTVGGYILQHPKREVKKTGGENKFWTVRTIHRSQERHRWISSSHRHMVDQARKKIRISNLSNGSSLRRHEPRVQRRGTPHSSIVDISNTLKWDKSLENSDHPVISRQLYWLASFSPAVMKLPISSSETPRNRKKSRVKMH